MQSNNIFFLQFNIVIGLINTVFFMLINLFSDLTLTENVNAIIVILSGFFLYYGIIVIVTKNYIYYRYSKEVFADNYKKWYYYLIGASVSILLLLNIAVKKWPNNLFTLQPIPKMATGEILKEEFTLAQYVDSLPKDKAPRYYIGSYGGGMKANAWTLTVLEELFNRKPTFFKNTIGMSGASGGTIGIINMAAIMGDNPKGQR